jgi:hypothetical protein
MRKSWLKKKNSEHKLRTLAVTALLGLSFVLLITPTASATFTNNCTRSEGGSRYNFELGWSDQTGWVVKDLKADSFYRIRWLNIPWVDLDATNAGVRYIDSAPTSASCTWIDGENRGYADSWWNYSGTHDAVSNPHVHVHVDHNDDGNFYVTVTLEGTSSKKSSIPLYNDWQINPASSAASDGGDDGIEVNSVNSGANFAEQRLEADLRAGNPFEDNKWYIVEASSGQYYAFMDGKFPSSDETNYLVNGYGNRCGGTNTCPDTNGPYPTHDGPWDFLNSESTYNSDVLFTVVKQRLVTTVASPFEALFRIFVF